MGDNFSKQEAKNKSQTVKKVRKTVVFVQNDDPEKGPEIEIVPEEVA